MLLTYIRWNDPFFLIPISAKLFQPPETPVNRAKGSIPTHFSYASQSRALPQHWCLVRKLCNTSAETDPLTIMVWYFCTQEVAYSDCNDSSVMAYNINHPCWPQYHQPLLKPTWRMQLSPYTTGRCWGHSSKSLKGLGGGFPAAGWGVGVEGRVFPVWADRMWGGCPPAPSSCIASLRVQK